MGIKSSFITNYCTQLKFQITQQNLMSHGYEKLQQNNIHNNENVNNSINNTQKQLYQHHVTKKLYLLQTISLTKYHANILKQSLESLEMVRNSHLCNVLFSSTANKHTLNDMMMNLSLSSSKSQMEVKIFSEYSEVTLKNLIEKKCAQRKDMENLAVEDGGIMVSNIEIANFIHDLAQIAEEIENINLPVFRIAPDNIIIVQNQGGKMKYHINFQQFFTQDTKSNTHPTKFHLNSYLPFQFFKHQPQSQLYLLNLHSQTWKQKYQKNCIFQLGMLALNFLLLQSNDQCYNQKQNYFCKSQLQKKIEKLSILLEKRLNNKKIIKQSRSSFEVETYVDRLHTKEEIRDEEEQFQFLLYQTVLNMVEEDLEKRLNVRELKQRSKMIMERVKEDYVMFANSKYNFFNMENAQRAAPKINKSGYTIKEYDISKFEKTGLKKVCSMQEKSALIRDSSNITQMKKSNSTTTTQFKLKKYISRQNKSSISDKQNNLKDINLNNSSSNLSPYNDKKNEIRKLSGIKKVQTSQYSFLEGYFQNNMAHGLGKITKRNGQIVECIFHNNQIIEEILPH